MLSENPPKRHGLAEAAKAKKKGKDGVPVASSAETADTTRRSLIPNQDAVTSTAVATPVFPCDAKNSQNWMIYCQGYLLHAVSLLDIYKDPKTFVDKPLRKDPETVINEFHKKFPNQISINDREALRAFVEENFDAEGSDIEQFVFTQCPEGTMQDWEDEPEYLIAIEDPELRQFAMEIHEQWKKLCHIVKPEVLSAIIN
ncbi:unnamed protein product [Gongylonema pulchrum]|uniref:Trehalase n=1 Tax=Gongylonema pulchrum TaxID=637853 RepID=A0A183DGM3_9BILA|nr:unnamed protein product [Gongylonema pulchrum]